MFDADSMILLPKTAAAFGYIIVTRQSTDDNDVRTKCINAATELGANAIVITDDGDPEADIRKIELEVFFDAVSELKNLKATLTDEPVIAACQTMIGVLEDLIQSIISPANGPR